MSNYPALFQPTIGYTILNSMQNMRHKKELWKSFGLLKNMKVPDSIISPPKKNFDLQDTINIQIPLCVKEVSQVPNWNHLYFTSTTKCPYNWRLLYFDCKSCLFYILLVDIVVLYTEFSGHLMKLSQNIRTCRNGKCVNFQKCNIYRFRDIKEMRGDIFFWSPCI